MRTILIACLLGITGVTPLLAIEPVPREADSGASEEAATPSDPLRPQAMAAIEETPKVPDEASDAALAKSYYALGVAAYVNSPRRPELRDRAVDLLERAVVADPANIAYKIELADVYMFLGNDVAVGAAIDLYEEALDADPQHDAVLGRAATAYLRMGNAPATFKLLARRAAGKYADVRATALQLAATALESGDIRRGVEETARLVRLHPQEPMARLVLAMLLADVGRNAEGLELVDTLITDLPFGSSLGDAARELKARILP